MEFLVLSYGIIDTKVSLVGSDSSLRGLTLSERMRLSGKVMKVSPEEAV